MQTDKPFRGSRRDHSDEDEASTWTGVRSFREPRKGFYGDSPKHFDSLTEQNKTSIGETRANVPKLTTNKMEIRQSTM